MKTDIPDKDDYYWVKLQPQWPPQIIEYISGVVYITGSRHKFSPYEDVYSWLGRIEDVK